MRKKIGDQGSAVPDSHFCEGAVSFVGTPRTQVPPQQAWGSHTDQGCMWPALPLQRTKDTPFLLVTDGDIGLFILPQASPVYPGCVCCSFSLQLSEGLGHSSVF
jgi:hypothetical protein